MTASDQMSEALVGWHAEAWRDAGVLDAVRSGKDLGSMERGRIVEWYEAAIEYVNGASMEDTAYGEPPHRKSPDQEYDPTPTCMFCGKSWDPGRNVLDKYACPESRGIT